MRIFKFLGFLACLMIGTISANAQDLQKGLDAMHAKDFKTALQALLPLAEGGNADAMEMVGNIYYDGSGVVQDYAESLKWYKLAAQNGSSAGQWDMGSIYEYGDMGLLQDYVRAHMWYNVSAANADKSHSVVDAVKSRDDLATKMTKEEIAKAQEMAHVCIDSGYKDCGL
jgi:TPR repeat protein